MSSVNIIITLSHLPILVAVISAAWLYPTLGRTLEPFCWFIFLSGVVQFTSLVFFFLGKNNMPLLHFYVAAGVPTLVWFYKTIMQEFINASIMWSIAGLFLVFTIINSLFIQNIYHFNSYALVVESIIVIILALFTFIFLLNDTMKETGIPDIKSLSWINTGLFIYYLSCLLIFYFGDAILSRFSKDLSGLTWIFHSFFSVVMYTCFIIGLWKRSKTRHL